ncbi:B12-binding domain-containing protein [Streptomyces sp. DH37]|uniref:cobalamin B12-binding domain-containing protein n=1 Tax=Streptomyces sp. DH37 TaxID=3040122 RepID=UPI0024410BEB|nr:B12-binding domain-containing protein [Streptomyces sp. DH37]MDG9706026.1 cobalamin-dependent protein [Streptomyces sp. DH37]
MTARPDHVPAAELAEDPAAADPAAAAGPRAAREEAREELWEAVREGDEHAASETVFAALDAGADPEEVLLDVIAPVQRKVGTEWAADRITVAQEHAATAINDRIIAALAHRVRGGRSGAGAWAGRVTVACVDGEWHALPARLLAEVLSLRGWQVDFLGAQVPTPHLVAHLHRTGPCAVALSSSIPTRLPTAHATITACQAAGVPVLAGGAAFGPDGRYARLLGADAWAPDASAAADRLSEGMPLPGPPSAHHPAEDLPHLADQEYTMVTRTAPQLVRETLTGLEERFPAMRDYTERQRLHTTEDIAHIVDFLATALYVDDEELFTGFMTWTAEILAARRVPARSLHPALDLLAGQLKDFPRAARLLDRARQALDAGPAPNPMGTGEPG